MGEGGQKIKKEKKELSNTCKNMATKLFIFY